MELSRLSPQQGPDFLVRHFHEQFIQPLQEYSSQGCKKIRTRLVQLGTTFGNPEMSTVSAVEGFCQAIELLHSGTLIIDDIQDGSLTRRGRASLHIEMGLARALNLGSWLLSASQKMVEVSVENSRHRERLLLLLRDTLYWGHLGQSLDLAIDIREVDRARVSEVIFQSHRFKTASVTALSVAGGAILAGADLATEDQAFALGERVGLLLQKLDDLKNLRWDRTTPEKRFEDLRQHRPSYVWAWASRSENIYENLVASVNAFPDETQLLVWLKETQIFELALAELREEMKEIEFSLHSSQKKMAHEMFEQLLAAVEGTQG